MAQREFKPEQELRSWLAEAARQDGVVLVWDGTEYQARLEGDHLMLVEAASGFVAGRIRITDDPV